jgi:acetyltransferase-like isoleucine patch superfamily enzyme
MIKKYIVNIIKRIISPNKYSDEAYIKYLREKGGIIGKGVKIWEPASVRIDVTRPHLLRIGDYCKITRGVIILTHDYSRSVLRLKYGEIIGEAKETIIGDNCFIGINSIILAGAKIGNNCIVGAGSVVSGEYPDNSVIAGNPARTIISIDEYYSKRKSKSIYEAKFYAKRIYERTGRVPTIKDMGSWFCWLYLPRTTESVKEYNSFFTLSGDDSDDIIKCFMESEPIYQSFDDFLEDCGIPSP